MTTDHADKSMYRPTPKRSPKWLLACWIVYRWMVQWRIRQIEADNEYWHDMELYAASRQRVNALLMADGKRELTEANRVIGELGK